MIGEIHKKIKEIIKVNLFWKTQLNYEQIILGQRKCIYQIPPKNENSEIIAENEKSRTN